LVGVGFWRRGLGGGGTSKNGWGGERKRSPWGTQYSHNIQLFVEESEKLNPLRDNVRKPVLKKESVWTMRQERKREKGAKAPARGRGRAKNSGRAKKQGKEEEVDHHFEGGGVGGGYNYKRKWH